MPLTPVKATYVNAPRVSARLKAHQSAIFPAPQLGLDYTRSLPLQDPRAANRLENFVVRRAGSELRPGYRRWVSNLPEVVTVMTYNPPTGAGMPLPKLFAACADGGIYDVTDALPEGTTPTPMVTIPGGLIPGRFSHTNFATPATNFLCACSAGAGYWTYDSVGGWVNRTGSLAPGPGADAAINYDFIIAWKNRLWFIENGRSEAAFLPTNAIQGTTSPFDFGPLLVHGGSLQAMASWTLDSGDGIDDKLVIVAGGGDVLVYEGTDPTSASTFRMVGRWYIGRPPNGRRFMSKYGGDLTMITANGIEYMSRLLAGKSMLDPEGPSDNPATRYNAVIGEEVRATYNGEFWHPVFVPAEQIVVLVTPFSNGVAGKQHVFSTLQGAWSQFKGMPMACADTMNGVLYFGTKDGNIGQMFGAPKDDARESNLGREVTGRLQSSFIAPGADVVALKRPLLLMPMFIAQSAPGVKVQINTEWQVSVPPGQPTYVPPDVALWDVAHWDVSKYSGDLYTFSGWVGAQGLGVYMSLAMSLTGAPRTLFTSWKLLYEAGGVM